MYKKLVEFYELGQLSFKYVKTFNMDEYVGLPHSHPESYHYFMYENLFKHIDIDPGRASPCSMISISVQWWSVSPISKMLLYYFCIIANTHILDGNAKDLVKECNDFEEKIVKAGGIDLFIGGE